MTVTPNGQDRQDANLAQQRKRTLLGLLKAEPETLHGLIRCTGWGEHHTRMALLQLCADGKVRFSRRSYRQYFDVLFPAHQSPSNNKQEEKA